MRRDAKPAGPAYLSTLLSQSSFSSCKDDTNDTDSHLSVAVDAPSEQSALNGSEAPQDRFGHPLVLAPSEQGPATAQSMPWQNANLKAVRQDGRHGEALARDIQVSQRC